MPRYEGDPTQRGQQASQADATSDFALPLDHPLVKEAMERQRRFVHPLDEAPESFKEEPVQERGSVGFTSITDALGNHYGRLSHAYRDRGMNFEADLFAESEEEFRALGEQFE